MARSRLRANRVTEVRRVSYGPDPSQFGDLHLPAHRGPWPVVVVIHGGFWRARYDLSLGTPLASDLAERGLAAWNIEYRRVGNGGGWPETALDVAAAVDRLAVIKSEGGPGSAPRQARGTDAATADTPRQDRGTDAATAHTPRQDRGTDAVLLDLSRVIALGHSAGGHLAAWLAGRARLAPPFGPPGVPVTGVVSQAGVLDLESAGAAGLGDGAVDAFVAGKLTRADDWRAASPARLLPFGVPIRCVHGDRDEDVPIQQSQRLVAAARLLGDDADLITVPGGDHYGVITHGDPGWTASVQAVEELLAAS